MRKNQMWGLSLTVLSLVAFSHFAGLGLRGIYERVKGLETAGKPVMGYPLIASTAPRVPDPDMRPGALYNEVLNKLRLYYVEDLPGNTALSYGSADSMLASLGDPNSRMLSQDEVNALRAASQGEFHGLGAVLTVERYNASIGGDEVVEEMPAAGPGAPVPANRGIRTITVVSVLPGSPAEKAGLRPGDHITEVDGRWVAPVHLSYRALTQMTDDLGIQDGRPLDPDDEIDPKPFKDPAREKLKKEAAEIRERWKNSAELPVVLRNLVSGQQGEHELTIERGRPAKTHRVKISLGKTSVPLFSSRTMENGVGYVQILGMNDAVRRQADEALTTFGKNGVQHLVVDLRNSAGGSLDSAREIAGLVLGDARFATVKERDAARKLIERPLTTVAQGAPRIKPARISVLVNGGTAGSSELLAAALRDAAGARLVGETTFGDGSEQELVVLDNGSGFTLTRARMLTSKQVDFEGKGLKPDTATQGDALEAALKG